MIPFLDLAADFDEVEDDARRRIDGVLSRQQFVLGPETIALEDSLRLRLGTPAAIAVSSGTDALTLSLLALGIGAGDAVVVPAFTFFATAGAVVRAGAEPVFCDIDRSTYLAGPRQMCAAIDREFVREAGELRRRGSGARLAALMPVHLYGRAADMEGIDALAHELRIRVIEDAAQALGARIGAKAVGAFGDTGCVSFYPTKNLGGAGDGGLVACRDSDVAARVARLRSHGGEHGTYEHHEAGLNARMSELVAAVLNAKLVRFDEWTARRRSLAESYGRRLADAARRGLLELPAPCDLAAHVWHQYAVRIAGASCRDRVQSALEAAGIATRVFYPLPLHRQPCFAPSAAGVSHPEAEAASAEVLCLPIYPSMCESDVDEVASALVTAVEAAPGAA